MNQPIHPGLAKFQAHKAANKQRAIRNKVRDMTITATAVEVMETNARLTPKQAIQIAKRSVELNGQ